MKKIALCLSGQPRYLEEGFKQLSKIILNYDVDVFIHTWWDDSYVNKVFDFSPMNTYNRTGVWEYNTKELIQSLYTPKKIIIEPQKDFNKHVNVNFEKQSPISLYSMYYSILQSNKLKTEYENENNFKYDCVIRSRFDILINTFNLELDSIDLTKIYVSGEINPYPNDQFAFSNSKNMDYYSDLFNNIDYYYNNGFREFVNEKILKYHLTTVGGKEIYFSDNNELYCNIIKK